MKICVTGGAGYIGSHTCKALAKSGHEVVVYDNLSTGHREFARYGDFVHGDIRDTQGLRKCFREYKPDGVIHFAAYINVGESVANPGKYYSNNVGGTLSLLEAMRDEHVPAIVVSSSAAVYGQPESMPISEDSVKDPTNSYGATKLFMERMLQDFSIAHGVVWTALRYFNAAGSSPDGEIGELHNPETHLIPRVMMATLGRISKVDIFGNDYPTPDGTCVRDYIHVDDLANAHILAMRRLLDGGESVALNLGTGRGSSVLEIVRGVEDVSGKKTPVNMVGRRAGDPAILVADPAKARDILGWQAERSLGEMIENAWNFITRQ